jgi:hypothetical protein
LLQLQSSQWRLVYSKLFLFPVAGAAPEVFPFPTKIKVIKIQKDEGYEET